MATIAIPLSTADLQLFFSSSPPAVVVSSPAGAVVSSPCGAVVHPCVCGLVILLVVVTPARWWFLRDHQRSGAQALLVAGQWWIGSVPMSANTVYRRRLMEYGSATQPSSVQRSPCPHLCGFNVNALLGCCQPLHRVPLGGVVVCMYCPSFISAVLALGSP